MRDGPEDWPPAIYYSWRELRTVHKKAFPASYEPGAPRWHRWVRAFYLTPEQIEGLMPEGTTQPNMLPNGAVICWKGAVYFPDFQRLMAHEKAHHTRLIETWSTRLHPRSGWRRYFDVAGVGLRITDRDGWMERTKAWREAMTGKKWGA